MICTPKVGLIKPTIEVQIFMGKYYTIEFKLQVLQSILNRKMSIKKPLVFIINKANSIIFYQMEAYRRYPY